MHPANVLSLQVDLVKRLRDPLFGRMMSTYLRSNIEDQSTGAMPDDLDIAPAMRDWTKAATAYRVEAPMTARLRERADALNDEEPIERFIPPTNIGFLVLEEPLRTIEARGRTALVHMLLWARCTLHAEIGGAEEATSIEGWLVVGWNDTRREPDEVTYDGRRRHPRDQRKLDEVVGRWAPSHAEFIADDWTLGPREVVLDEFYRDNVRASGYEPVAATANMRRVWCALFGMLSETIPGARRNREPLKPKDARKAERQRVTPEVQLVALRREDTSAHTSTGTGRKLEFRHFAGGTDGRGWPRRVHKGTDREYVTWVRPHLRGPADAPIKKPPLKIHNLQR